MVMALGVGVVTAAMFHLFTHAFFKALLFLGAGSVSHSGTHHSFDMKADMGGLRKYMPVTFWTFIDRDARPRGHLPASRVLVEGRDPRHAPRAASTVFLVVGLIGAFLTAAYMTRCVYLTFFGEYRGHGHPHESEKVITIPLIVLAVFSVVAGFLNAAPLHIEKFKEWVEPTVTFPTSCIPSSATRSRRLSVDRRDRHRRRGVLLVPARNGAPGPHRTQRARAPGYRFLEKKYYLDDLYEKVIVGSIKGPIARGVYWFDQNVIDGVVNGAGTPGVRDFAYDVIDQKVVDGAANGLAEVTGETGGLLRYLQSGRVQRYALLLFAAVGLLSLALLIANV